MVGAVENGRYMTIVLYASKCYDQHIIDDAKKLCIIVRTVFWKHSVKPPTFGIVAFVLRNVDLFVAAVFITKDMITVTTEHRCAFWALRSKKFTALR